MLSGMKQKHLQTTNYNEFCCIIKVLIIIICTLEENQNLDLSKTLVIDNRNTFEY